jgi:hypothetical protein
MEGVIERQHFNLEYADKDIGMFASFSRRAHLLLQGGYKCYDVWTDHPGILVIRGENVVVLGEVVSDNVHPSYIVL